MFNKALFKQSAKAHFTKWLAITVATCMIVAMIIFVLGNIQISGISESLKSVFFSANEEAVIKENAIDSYDLYLSSVEIEHNLSSLSSGRQTLGDDEENFKALWDTVTTHYENELENFEETNGREATEEEKEGIRQQLAPGLIEYFSSIGLDASALGFGSENTTDFLVCFMRAYDGNSLKYKDSASSQEFFTNAKPILTDAYISYVYLQGYALGERQENTTEELCQATAQMATLLAQTAMASYSADEEYAISAYQTEAQEYVNEMMASMASYIAPEGYTEEEIAQFTISVKVISNSAISTYQLWIDEGLEAGSARDEATKSISDQIPDDVLETLSDLGNMDLSGLIVGEMFYKIVGILLPMVFVITTANGLLAGQVDSGSMAYVLSTPTKRRTVTFTQMFYLISSIFVMFVLITICSVSALAIVGQTFGITFSEILLFNLGAFVTAFAIAGFCFMCSAIFNRSKYSMGLGGGLSIFFLVCTILGIFGSNAMPQAMRISAMNIFNYMSIISLFDTGAILSGGLGYLWKLAILLTAGIVCFIVGIFRFEKKDLPL